MIPEVCADLQAETVELRTSASRAAPEFLKARIGCCLQLRRVQSKKNRHRKAAKLYECRIFFNMREYE